MIDRQPAKLALADGTIFEGWGFGALSSDEPAVGEVVFNTSMTGYQEILTDPSYAGQIVTMTYPLIGNYGVNEEDVESESIRAAGFVVRELAAAPSNYRATRSLDAWLSEQGVPGVAGIDTRALTRKLRLAGVINGVIGPGRMEDAALVERARRAPSMAGSNLAERVSRDEAGDWSPQLDLGDWAPSQGEPIRRGDHRYKVVALDCGAKHNILRHLVSRNIETRVMPFDASPEAILAEKPDGLFISNGPGDPEPVDRTIATLAALREELPMFGICLGLQLLALALGARTYKLKFGHRGGNQPVQNLATGKVEITSQNHGFAVDIDSLKAVGGEPTHVNLNDGTLAGFRHTTRPIFAVQYHPEASPGPHDASYLFDCFVRMLSTRQPPTAREMDEAQRSASLVALS